ncbi:villin [Capsaspora owczarzaki ATCC 30864]|uniref:Villin n=1 Tax=Capsaspora owczarzaki (strain ATCC 30864) TaxID=595528 RepID=A0A0D2X2S5_CAPO3|nr:villin [Capsaspora owczarzaki ATCC 30864]KJE93069.1 villin [Capsaspora owczarzaki ATCC 30864]|eukprot:XP_004363643.2 villin [Capsaspora owczarzaki ATCC 30864]
MSVDPAFANAGKKAGLEIWRIEKLKPILVDASKHGSFHSGDSYICLQTKAKSAGFEWNIHFWLGKETSSDEAGVAAYKTVELDDSLGGAPVQFREVEGHESNQFLALFPKGIKYLPGGVESGFKHVEKDKFEKRLLHLKGKRQVRVAQVALSSDSLNQGDVFILDNGRQIIQWNGRDSSKAERSKGLEVSKRIRDEERGGNAEIAVIEDGSDDDTAFFNEIGGKKRIKTAEEGGDDASFERSKQADVKLYRVSDASGSVKITEVASPPLNKDMLDTNDCFILDQGGAAIFAWIGKKATKQERSSAMKLATDFIAQKKYPSHTQVTKVNESGETPLFKANFAVWPEAAAGTTPQGSNRSNIARVDPNKKVDVKGMHSQAAREREAAVDDGSGKLQIWRIENFEKVAIPQAEYGQFYSGDSYILLYTYLKNSKECYIIYYWQGLKSTTDEKGASAILATKLDDELGGAPVQVRVVQNKEPEHFLRLFKGKMMVHEGGKGSGFKNAAQADSYDTDGTRLFQVRGTNEFNTRAVQVAERAASLNSNDTFVLETPKKVYIWFGKGATGDEREIAKIVAKQVAGGKEADNVSEGSEPADFWAALGGKGEYASSPRLADSAGRAPRLFQCSNSKGYFYVEEIFDFDQSDLVEDDVMLLDTYDELVLWLGSGANDKEKAEAVRTATEYITTDPAGRDKDTPINVVKQGYEPPSFTAYFGAWDADKWSNGLTYEQLKAQIGSSGPTSGAALLSSVDKSGPVTKFYTFAQLTTHPIPEDVDKAERERWLSDADFKTVFKMSREEFSKLPAWKKTDTKKKINLF